MTKRLYEVKASRWGKFAKKAAGAAKKAEKAVKKAASGKKSK
jgi:hypothetical protein